jgi:hypothetical protein
MAHKPVDIGSRGFGDGFASTGQQRQEGLRSLNVPMQSTLRDAAMSAAVLDICGQQCCQFGRRTCGAPWRDRDLQRTQRARPGVKSVPGSKTRTRTDWPPGSGTNIRTREPFYPLEGQLGHFIEMTPLTVSTEAPNPLQVGDDRPGRKMVPPLQPDHRSLAVVAAKTPKAHSR